MPNSMSVYHILQVDFGEGYLVTYLVTCCDGGKTKSTPSPRPKTGVRQNDIFNGGPIKGFFFITSGAKTPKLPG